MTYTYLGVPSSVPRLVLKDATSDVIEAQLLTDEVHLEAEAFADFWISSDGASLIERAETAFTLDEVYIATDSSVSASLSDIPADALVLINGVPVPYDGSGSMTIPFQTGQTAGDVLSVELGGIYKSGVSQLQVVGMAEARAAKLIPLESYYAAYLAGGIAVTSKLSGNMFNTTPADFELVDAWTRRMLLANAAGVTSLPPQAPLATTSTSTGLPGAYNTTEVDTALYVMEKFNEFRDACNRTHRAASNTLKYGTFANIAAVLAFDTTAADSPIPYPTRTYT